MEMVFLERYKYLSPYSKNPVLDIAVAKWGKGLKLDHRHPSFRKGILKKIIESKIPKTAVMFCRVIW